MYQKRRVRKDIRIRVNIRKGRRDREEIDVGALEGGRRGVRHIFDIKRKELERISEFGVIFEGEDGIKRGD